MESAQSAIWAVCRGRPAMKLRSRGISAVGKTAITAGVKVSDEIAIRLYVGETAKNQLRSRFSLNFVDLFRLSPQTRWMTLS